MNNWNTWGAPLKATYYFDPLHGSDSANGTSPATPWLTQAKAEQVVLTAGQSVMKKIDGEWIVFRTCATAPSSAWVYGYYQTWPGTGTTTIPLSDINWGAYTHISHDHIEPNADGTLDGSANDITQANAAALIAAAHANGVKVLLNVADIWTHNFASAAVDHTATFINNIIRTIVDWGYDGVDIDWETGVTAARLHKFMSTLYPAIKAQNPNLIVNMAVGGGGSELSYIPCLPFTDSFAVMAYGLYLSGGKVTWLNAPLYDGDSWTYWGVQMMSLNLLVNNYLKLGANRPKLLAGLPFFAQVYGGGFNIGTDTGGPLRPRQPYTANYANAYYLGYNKAMIGYPTDANVPSGGYYTPARDHWDDLSKTPYLSIADANPDNNLYLTYDDPASITAKAQWMQAKGISGIAIWEISLDWMPSRTIKQPLAQALKDTLAPIHVSGSTPAAPTGLVASAASGSSIKLNWITQADAFKYRIKRATTSGGSYTTLATQRQAGFTDSTVSSGVTYYYVVSALGWGDLESSNSSQLTIVAAASSAPTNLVLDSGNLTTPNWNFSGTSATVSGTTIHTASAGVTDLNQVRPVSASTDYLATVTLTNVSATQGYGTLNIAGANAGGFYDVGLGFAGSVLTQNVPVTLHVAFNSGTTDPNVILAIDIPDGYAGLDIRVDHVSIVATAGAYVPSAPAGLTVSTPTPTNTFNKYSAVLNWGWALGASSFNVYRSVGDLGTNFVKIGSATDPTFTDTTVGPDASFTYAVTAVHGSVESLRSSNATVSTPAVYAPPNALVSPSDLTNAAWSVVGGDAAVSDARTLNLSSTGDTSLTQQQVQVEAGANYVASVTVTPSVGGWFIVFVYDITYGTNLATFGQGIEAGKAGNFRLTFDTQAFTNIVFVLEAITGSGTGNTMKVDGASVTKNLPEIPANLLAAPGDLTNPVWATDSTATTIVDATHFQCPAGKGGGIQQANVPCKPNTDYLATCSILRTDTSFDAGSGGYAVFQIYNSPDFNPSYGLRVIALAPGDPTEMYLAFNSGNSTNLIFVLSVNDDANGSQLAVSNLKIFENAYAHADTIAPVVNVASLGSVAVTPSTVIGGAILSGSVSLTAPAAGGGAVVTLNSLTAGVTVPASVNVPAGASSANFSITTASVTGNVTAQITAAYSGVLQATTFTLTPGIRVTGLSLSANSVQGGTSVTGTVSLSSAAPTGGQVVGLSISSSTSLTPPAPASGYTLAFSDEFDSFDLSSDGTGTHTWYPGLWYESASGAVNGSSIASSVLDLKWTRGQNPSVDTSIQTYNKANTAGRNFRYGYFEARMKWDVAQGAWPAFWLNGDYGQSNQGFMELDIFEGQGTSGKYYATLHDWIKDGSGTHDRLSDGSNELNIGSVDFSQWHTYGCLWTPGQIKWYFDGTLIRTATAPASADSGPPLYLILSCQVGPGWNTGGSPTANTMNNFVDWVRVWQTASGGQAVTSSSYATVPGSVTVPAGSLTGTFTITTTTPPSNVTATITAAIQGAASSSSATATLTVNSSTAVAVQIAADTFLGNSSTAMAPHEGYAHGWPLSYTGGTTAVIGEGNTPPKTNNVSWNASIPWGVGYMDAAGDPSTNTRVQVRNLQIWFLAKSTGKWTQLVKTNNIDSAAYWEDFHDDTAITADVRTETEGISFGHIGKGTWAGRNVHFYATNRYSFNPADVGGWVSMFEFRAIKDNPAGADDTATAKIVFEAGADYWQTLTSAMPAGQTYEPAIGGGRYKYAKPYWRSASFTTLTLAQLTQNPPPIDLSADAA